MYAFPRIDIPEKAIEHAKSKKLALNAFYCFERLNQTGICVVVAVSDKDQEHIIFVQQYYHHIVLFYISLRAIYGKDLVHNAIDVSPDVQQAKNDINLLFGDLDRDEQGEKISIKISDK